MELLEGELGPIGEYVGLAAQSATVGLEDLVAPIRASIGDPLPPVRDNVIVLCHGKVGDPAAAERLTAALRAEGLCRLAGGILTLP